MPNVLPSGIGAPDDRHPVPQPSSRPSALGLIPPPLINRKKKGGGGEPQELPRGSAAVGPPPSGEGRAHGRANQLCTNQLCADQLDPIDPVDPVGAPVGADASAGAGAATGYWYRTTDTGTYLYRATGT